MTADCSAAEGAEHSVVGSAESFVTQDADCSVAGDAECFGGAFLVGSAYCHPSPLHVLPHSCKWGNVVPMSTFLQPA